jgi:hypothetical protein
MSEPRRDSAEGLTAGIAQALVILLHTQPDAADLVIPRRWVDQWLAELHLVLASLRQTP